VTVKSLLFPLFQGRLAVIKRTDMNKHPPLTGQASRPAMALGLLAFLLLWGCAGCSPSARAPSVAVEAPGALAAPPAAPATPPVVQVTGERSEFDLGTIKVGSRHRVIFAIHNDSDKPLKIREIRGDCPCITSAESPEYIAAGQVARVVALFEAPDVNVLYGSELIVVTDDPLRKIIRLAVRANIRR
jgi:hypothetical protein